MVLMALAYLSSYIVGSEKELNDAAASITESITNLEKDIRTRFPDEYVTNIAARKKNFRDEILNLNKLHYEVLIYRHDSLSLWTDNLIIPAQDINSFEKDAGFQKFKNGYYITYKETFTGKNGKNISLLVLKLLKSDYITPNSSLRNRFSVATL